MMELYFQPIVDLNLQQVVNLTNEISLEENNGGRNSCIMTSYALNNVLCRLGYDARPVRVEAAVHPNDRKLVGTILGGFPSGDRRPAAGPGGWHGHLAVAIDDLWLLDPTLDQANKEEWPRDAWVKPLAVKVTDPCFWSGNKSLSVQCNASDVRYRLYPRQNGFAHKGGARPSRWKPVSDAVIGALGVVGGY